MNLFVLLNGLEKNVDLIHTHGFKFNFLMGILPKTVRYIPQIVTLHGHVPAALFSKMWLYQTVDYLILSRTAKIIVVNEEMRDFPLIKALPRFKVAHISNGIEVHAATKSLLPSRVASFISKHHINLVAIGRLSPEKGFHLLIEALVNQKIDLRSIGVCILGEGSLQSYLQECIERRKLEGQILLGGYVSNADSLLHHFDALVMPSLTEGLPITVLEAMRIKVN
ncbi:MAG: glycosyltransferase [Candidatus Competibacteraceae bacterium]|nr:glycosyltransferase [Candidatus Competibacteraceae bacterium]